MIAAVVAVVVLGYGAFVVVSIYRYFYPHVPSQSKSIEACRAAVIDRLDLPKSTRFKDETVENAYGGDSDPAVKALGLVLDSSGAPRDAYICYLDFDANLYDLGFISPKEHMNRRAQERARLEGSTP